MFANNPLGTTGSAFTGRMRLHRSGELGPLIGSLGTLPVIAASIAFELPTWSVLALLAVVTIVVGRLLGVRAAFITATIAAAGFVLFDNRSYGTSRARGGRELAVMAGLLVVSVLFGARNPEPADSDDRFARRRR